MDNEILRFQRLRLDGLRSILSNELPNHNPGELPLFWPITRRQVSQFVAEITRCERMINRMRKAQRGKNVEPRPAEYSAEQRRNMASVNWSSISRYAA